MLSLYTGGQSDVLGTEAGCGWVMKGRSQQVPLSAVADFPKLLAMRLPLSPRVWWAPP